MKRSPHYRFARRLGAALLVASTAAVAVAFEPAVAVPPPVFNGEIVFMHLQMNSVQEDSVRTVWPDGTNEQIIQAGAYPVYSPDGSQIASLIGGGVSLTPADGGEPVVKLPGDGGGFSMAYSSDGASVAWPDDGGIVVAKLDGSTRQLLFGDDGETEFSPAFTPDGRIVYDDYVDGHFGIWIANSDGSDPSLVLNDARSYTGLDVSPDGEWVVLGSSEGVRLVRLDGTEDHTIVASGAITPHFSPDSQWIAFGREGDAAIQGIHIVKTDGTGMQRLTTGYDAWPDWRPVSSPLNHPPVAKFSKFAQLKPHYVIASGAPSTDTDGTIVSYEWRWGDGSAPSTTKQAWHQYKRAGWALIRLTVTDDKGASTTRAIWYLVN